MRGRLGAVFTATDRAPPVTEQVETLRQIPCGRETKNSSRLRPPAAIPREMSAGVSGQSGALTAYHIKKQDLSHYHRC